MLSKVPWQQALLSPRAHWAWYGVLAWPLVWMVWALFNDALGANPAEALSRSSGDWTLRWLCLVLAITPLRHIAGVPALFAPVRPQTRGRPVMVGAVLPG